MKVFRTVLNEHLGSTNNGSTGTESAHECDDKPSSPCNPIYPNLPSPSAPASLSSTSVSGGVSPKVLLALGLLATPSVHTCDDVLFLSSNGVLFVDKSMSTISTGLAFMNTGYSLCFKHESGLQEELKLEGISVVENYGAIYRTCDFGMDFKTYSSCLGSDLCWKSVNCHQGTRYSVVGPKAYKLPESQVGCRLIPNLDDACAYRQKCVWYYWDLTVKEDRCDTIYELLGSTKIAHFTHRLSSGNIVPFSLSMDSPRISSPIILHLGGVSTDYYPTPTHIRQHGDLLLGVHAARKNEGIAGLLGDLQVPLVRSGSAVNWTYPLHEVTCQPDARTMSCRAAPPAYQSTLRGNSHNILEGQLDESKLMVTRTRKMRGTAEILFRTATISSQIVESAECGVRVVSTYGCTSCDEMPVIVVKPHTIGKTGILKFSSNCSFYIPEISCSDQSQILQLTHRPTACDLQFPDSNQTLKVDISYEFLGQLYVRGVMTYRPEETFSSRMFLAVQSPDFLSNLQLSIGLGVATTLVIALLKVTAKFVAFRSGFREVKEITE